MKVTFAVVSAVVLGEKKVPPRRPEQRLNRLNLFSAEWLNDNLPDLPSKDRWIAKFQTNAARMLDAFNRPNCGFFDPNLPFGGPDNEPDLRPGGRARNRRSDPKNTFGSDFETYDYDDDGTLLRYDKNNPIRGIKQITTGYRKWAERYINECSGQRKSKFQVNRMNKWFQKLGKHYEKTQY